MASILWGANKCVCSTSFTPTAHIRQLCHCVVQGKRLGSSHTLNGWPEHFNCLLHTLCVLGALQQQLPYYRECKQPEAGNSNTAVVAAAAAAQSMAWAKLATASLVQKSPMFLLSLVDNSCHGELVLLCSHLQQQLLARLTCWAHKRKILKYDDTNT